MSSPRRLALSSLLAVSLLGRQPGGRRFWQANTGTADDEDIKKFFWGSDSGAESGAKNSRGLVPGH